MLRKGTIEQHVVQTVICGQGTCFLCAHIEKTYSKMCSSLSGKMLRDFYPHFCNFVQFERFKEQKKSISTN